MTRFLSFVMIILCMFLFSNCFVKKENAVSFHIEDSLTQKSIVNMSMIKLFGNRSYVFNVVNFNDTIICKMVLPGKYVIDVNVLGYYRYCDSIVLKKNDNMIRIKMISIPMDSINVDWNRAIITIQDKDGKIRCIQSPH